MDVNEATPFDVMAVTSGLRLGRMVDSTKEGLTKFYELSPRFRVRPNISNANNTPVLRRLGINLNVRFLQR